jgi:hypothetical protein
MKIAVTYSVCRQTGMDDYTNYYTTKAFDSSCTLDEIFNWYKQKTGAELTHISNLAFSMMEETP